MIYEEWDVPELPEEKLPVIVKKPEPIKEEAPKIIIPDAIQKKAAKANGTSAYVFHKNPVQNKTKNVTVTKKNVMYE